jgi:hypothetical protein
LTLKFFTTKIISAEINLHVINNSNRKCHLIANTIQISSHRSSMGREWYQYSCSGSLNNCFKILPTMQWHKFAGILFEKKPAMDFGVSSKTI